MKRYLTIIITLFLILQYTCWAERTIELQIKVLYYDGEPADALVCLRIEPNGTLYKSLTDRHGTVRFTIRAYDPGLYGAYLMVYVGPELVFLRYYRLADLAREVPLTIRIPRVNATWTPGSGKVGIPELPGSVGPARKYVTAMRGARGPLL